VPLGQKYRLDFRREPAAEASLAEFLQLGKYRNGYVATSSKSSFSAYHFGLKGGFVEVSPVNGFCIFDWVRILEEAKKIMCVDSSALNLVNQLGIGVGRRYYWTWHNIRAVAVANRNTPHLADGWEKFVPVEFDGQTYPPYLHDNNASQHIVEYAARYCPPGTRGLDIGGGANPYPYASCTLDVKQGQDIEKVKEFGHDLDYIFSSHMLEHLDDQPAFVYKAWEALKRGGTLFLYLPHPSCGLWSPKNPEMQGRYGHKYLRSPKETKALLRSVGFRVIDSSSNPDYYFSYYVVGIKK
jgi:SAM-dependent methyltransferase